MKLKKIFEISTHKVHFLNVVMVRLIQFKKKKLISQKFGKYDKCLKIGSTDK